MNSMKNQMPAISERFQTQAVITPVSSTLQYLYLCSIRTRTNISTILLY